MTAIMNANQGFANKSWRGLGKALKKHCAARSSESRKI
jgi:hypothetical protein